MENKKEERLSFRSIQELTEFLNQCEENVIVSISIEGEEAQDEAEV